MPSLTKRDLTALTSLHGGTIEYQEAQTKLFAMKTRWCPACSSVLPTTYFARNKRMNLGLDSRCRTCAKKHRSRTFTKLSNPTRLARFYKRNPDKRPTPLRGPYEKTFEDREAGEYIVDPIHNDLWLASPSK